MSALKRPRHCPVELLEPGDVIEVYVCIENDESDWESRTVMANDGEQLTLLEPPSSREGHGRVYSVPVRPGKSYRLRHVDQPLLWEGDDG